MIRAIVCVNNDWAIGKNGGLLYSLKEDMNFFKKTTLHHPIVIGENTLLSFPGRKPLKNRTNIVLCPEGHEYDDCICFHDFNKLVAFMESVGKDMDIYVCGGAMLYASMLPYCEEVYVTKVDDSDKEATVFFPNLDNRSDFVQVAETEPIIDNGYSIKFCTYKKVDLPDVFTENGIPQ